MSCSPKVADGTGIGVLDQSGGTRGSDCENWVNDLALELPTSEKIGRTLLAAESRGRSKASSDRAPLKRAEIEIPNYPVENGSDRIAAATLNGLEGLGREDARQ